MGACDQHGRHVQLHLLAPPDRVRVSLPFFGKRGTAHMHQMMRGGLWLGHELWLRCADVAIRDVARWRARPRRVCRGRGRLRSNA